MDREIKKRKPISLSASEDISREIWCDITQDVLLKLIQPLPRLCQAVIEAKGGYFDEKYAHPKIQEPQSLLTFSP